MVGGGDMWLVVPCGLKVDWLKVKLMELIILE